MRGQTKRGSKDFYDGDEQGLEYPASTLGYWDPTLEPDLGKGSIGALSIRSGQGQPKKETWVRPHGCSPPTGGDIEVRCYVDRVAVKGGGLGGPIPSY